MGCKGVISAIKINIFREKRSLINEVLIPVMRKGWGLNFLEIHRVRQRWRRCFLGAGWSRQMDSLNRRPQPVVRGVGAQPELACAYPRERIASFHRAAESYPPRNICLKSLANCL